MQYHQVRLIVQLSPSAYQQSLAYEEFFLLHWFSLKSHPPTYHGRKYCIFEKILLTDFGHLAGLHLTVYSLVVAEDKH